MREDYEKDLMERSSCIPRDQAKRMGDHRGLIAFTTAKVLRRGGFHQGVVFCYYSILY